MTPDQVLRLGRLLGAMENAEAASAITLVGSEPPMPAEYELAGELAGELAAAPAATGDRTDARDAIELPRAYGWAAAVSTGWPPRQMSMPRWSSRCSSRLSRLRRTASPARQE